MTPTGGLLYPRLSVVAIAVATVGAVLALRLGYLGTVGAKGLPVAVPSADLAPQRGSLWDRQGELLATERYVYDAALAPREVDDPDAFARAVAPALALAEADVRQAAGDVSQVWVPLAAAVPAATARALDDLSLPGLHLAREPRRAYPLDVATAHVTGFVDASGTAFYGVEEYHDDALRGAPGSLVGPYGSDPRAYRAPVDGTSLVLTIDRELQAVASTTLAEAVADQQATGGSIVILEPATGALLASASWPSFDPNDVASADPATFPDPAVSAIYEPGSVLKSVTIAAGIDAGVIQPDSTYEDTGTIEVGGLTIANWDNLPHGTTTMTELLAHSLNVGAVTVAEALGPERFYGALAAFGFGHATGVDVSGEVDGLVNWPTGDAAWHAGQMATTSFGQGIAATPLQVAAAIAAIANDGRLMRPHVVAATIAPDGTISPVAPRLVRQVVSPQTARQVREMLAEVVSSRVAQAAVPGYRVAGKTGTSQIPIAGGYDLHDTIASFAGFVPVDNPMVTILVKIDRPNAVRGSDVAAPVFADVARAAVEILDIPPDRPVTHPGDAP